MRKCLEGFFQVDPWNAFLKDNKIYVIRAGPDHRSMVCILLEWNLWTEALQAIEVLEIAALYSNIQD